MTPLAPVIAFNHPASSDARGWRAFKKRIFMTAKVLNLMRIAFAVVVASSVFVSGVKGETTTSAPINNPLNKGRGPTFDDAHGVVHNGRVYLFACHDFSPENRNYILKDWWIWSSSDLIDWKLESVLRPETTFIGQPFNDCWATFGVERAGKWYWYFAAGPHQIGVVTADSPAGPWKDPLGAPLIPKGMYPTATRDPDILMDEDGNAYMIFGAFKYYIVRLGENMISTAEQARPVVIKNAYGPFGAGATDDKPSLHKRNGLYYLSWSSFYAVASNVYGPYEYKGSVIDAAHVAPEFLRKRERLFIDRHGNFFEYNNQWYYVFNDQSQPGRHGFYRDSIMTYVHYKDNGEIAPVRIDSLGVGQYDATRPQIEAEDYFKAVHAEKRECRAGGFEMRNLTSGSELYYPNIHNVPANAKLTFNVASADPKDGMIEVREGLPDGKLLGSIRVPNTRGWDKFQSVACPLKNAAGRVSLCLVFKGGEQEFCRLDWLAFAPSTSPQTETAKSAPVIPPTFNNVSYGEQPAQVMDVWLVKSDNPTPVVVFIHGGSWVIGTRAAVQKQGLASLLQAGISVISIDYRMLPIANQAGIKPPVKWPLSDAARALQFIRSKSAEWNLDKSRIGLMGVSAGGCSSLWLAMHDDMADPKSPDPVARESTRVACAGVTIAQTTLDPKQLFEWFKEPTYGGHAFGFVKTKDNRIVNDMDACLAAREQILPWIKEYSPIEWASADDPPIFLAYNDVPQPKGTPQLDSVHGAAYGIHLKEALDKLGVECQVVYPFKWGDPEPPNIKFLIQKLTSPSDHAR